MNANSELDALIYLLEDPDDQVYKSVSEKLITLGQEVIPVLEATVDHKTDELSQIRIGKLIEQIYFDSLCGDFQKWLNNDPEDLFEGMMLLARLDMPEINYDYYYRIFQQVFRKLWLEFHNDLTSLEQVILLNKLIFDQFDFTAIAEENCHYQDNFIHYALEYRRATPRVMGLLYIIFAQKLNIPIYGINLPNQFTVCKTAKLVDEYDLINNSNTVIEFYINTYQNGDIFDRKEIDRYIFQLELKAKPNYYLPNDPTELIYAQLEDMEKAFIAKNNESKIIEINILKTMIRKSQ